MPSSSLVKTQKGLKTDNGGKINFVFKVFSKVLFWVFVLMLLYTTTFLPAGRYYQIVWGNIGMLLAYLYVLVFLVSFKLKNPQELDSIFFKKYLL